MFKNSSVLFYEYARFLLENRARERHITEISNHLKQSYILMQFIS